MNTTARHDLPEENKGLAQLAFLLGYDAVSYTHLTLPTIA